MTDLEQKVKQIIREQLQDGTAINSDAKLKDDLKMDSLEIVSMQMELETEFHIRIPDESIETLVTVGDVVQLITKMIS